MRSLPAVYETHTVAITGCNGFIGRALTAGLSGIGARLLLVSRHAPEAVAGAEAIAGDVGARDVWRDIMRRADIVFHLAGNTSVYAAAADPEGSFRSTVLPMAHLAAAAQEAGRSPRVVLASTATVYGLPADLPVGEDTPPDPITTYDLHKWNAEQYLNQATAQGVLHGVSLRLPTVYGPSAAASAARERGVLNTAARRALAGEDLLLYDDGGYLRDFVYIDDVVAAFLIAGVQPGMHGRVFNVGSGSGVTVRDAFHLVADRARSHTGAGGRVRSVPPPAHADPIEFRNYVADISRIADACGWAPRVPLREGVDRLLTFLQARPPARAAETPE